MTDMPSRTELRTSTRDVVMLGLTAVVLLVWGIGCYQRIGLNFWSGIFLVASAFAPLIIVDALVARVAFEPYGIEIKSLTHNARYMRSELLPEAVVSGRRVVLKLRNGKKVVLPTVGEKPTDVLTAFQAWAACA